MDSKKAKKENPSSCSTNNPSQGKTEDSLRKYSIGGGKKIICPKIRKAEPEKKKKASKILNTNAQTSTSSSSDDFSDEMSSSDEMSECEMYKSSKAKRKKLSTLLDKIQLT